MIINDELLCASYIRYSSSRQRKGHSKETQSSKNRYTIDHVIGGKFVGEYVDDAISGFHNNFYKRKGLLGILKAICEKKINCIVFYDESRFSRRIVDFYSDFLLPILGINPSVKFFRSIDIDETAGIEWNPEDFEVKRNFILANMESTKKQAYAKKGMKMSLDKKIRPGSRLPYGIEHITQNELIPNDDIAVVLLIFELASWGYSESNIAEILSDLSIETRFSNTNEDSNAKWNPSSVHYIVNNQIYIGKGYWDRRTSINNSTPKPVDQQTKFGEYHPIIPVQLWTMAHEEKGRKSSRLENGKIRMNTSYLLSDIVACKNCNDLLKTKNSSKGTLPQRKTKRGKPLIYYYCPKCSLKIDSSELDHMIIDQIKSTLIGQFDPATVTIKINDWIKVIEKSKLAKEKQLHIEKVDRSLKKMKKMLTPSEHERYLVIQDEYIIMLENEIIDIKMTLNELKNIKNSDTIMRLQKRLSAFQEEPNKIEARYLLFMCIDSLEVSLNKDENINIYLNFRDIPLPLLQNKLKSQKF